MGWERAGVPQRRLVHGFLPLARLTLRTHAPDLVERLHSIGAHDVDLLEPLRDRVARPGDEELLVLRCRRTVFEWVLRQAAGLDRRVTVRAGASVAALAGEAPSGGRLPAVTGVKLRSGEVVPADLVVDASGRGSAAPSWLAGIGAAQPAEERQPCRIIYFSRFYERPEGGFPVARRVRLGYAQGAAAGADGRAFSISFFVRAEVPALRGLRDSAAFERAVAAIAGYAPWRAGARPLGPVATMGAIENRYRRFLSAGRPLATGFIPVGDSLSHTNPTLGRGMSLALDQAFRAAGIGWSRRDLEACAVEYHRQVEPAAEASFTDAFVADDVATRAFAGDAMAEADPRIAISRATSLAALRDHDLYRAIVRHTGLLMPPGSLYTEPWVGRARALLLSPDSGSEAGPDLEQMLRLLEAPSSG